MWNAQIIDVTKNLGSTSVFVVFYNDKEKFTEEYKVSTSVDMEWLNQLVANRLKGMEAAYAFADLVPKGASFDDKSGQFI